MAEVIEKTACPVCGHQTLLIEYIAIAKVEFNNDPDADQDHEVLEAIPGDIGWDNDSCVQCWSCDATGVLSAFRINVEV